MQEIPALQVALHYLGTSNHTFLFAFILQGRKGFPRQPNYGSLIKCALEIMQGQKQGVRASHFSVRKRQAGK